MLAGTRLGVLGWPVAHSRSPAMQEAALRHLELDGWTYQKLPVPPDLFAETVRALPGAGFGGANVTIPHKEAALALADEATDRAAAIGAANTLSFRPDGTIAADNTDAPGLVAAAPVPLAGARALVLGAGGSARAAVWALRDAGAREVLVWNRTPEKAVALADAFGGRAVAEPEPADVLVHCSSVGLHGEDQLKILPLDADALMGYSAVLDFVYRETGTALVREARARGVKAVDGLEILVHQGARSLEIWTGLRAPVDVMREAAG